MDEARKVLLDFYRSQLNTHIQIILSAVIALVFQIIVLKDYPMILIFVGTTLVIFIGLNFLKMWWYSRLWNAMLMTKPADKSESLEEIKRQYREIPENMYEARVSITSYGCS